MKKGRHIFLILMLSFLSKSICATAGDTLTVNPNPFDSITVIHFDIAANDTIWLDVFSAWGNTVKTYFNATVLPSGSYSLNFNGDTLPKGIYFVRLKINSKTLSVKLLKTANAVGVKENENRKITSLLYPNPTTSTLEIPIDGLKTVIVTDLNGKILLNSTVETKSISLADLAIGSYIVSVLSVKKQLLATQKIIKTN